MPDWQVTLGKRGLLAPGKLYIGYTEMGGPLKLYGDQILHRYRVVDPCSGEILREGTRDSGWAPAGLPSTSPGEWIPDEGGGPRVYICYDEPSV